MFRRNICHLFYTASPMTDGCISDEAFFEWIALIRILLLSHTMQCTRLCLSVRPTDRHMLPTGATSIDRERLVFAGVNNLLEISTSIELIRPPSAVSTSNPQPGGGCRGGGGRDGHTCWSDSARQPALNTQQNAVSSRWSIFVRPTPITRLCEAAGTRIYRVEWRSRDWRWCFWRYSGPWAR